MRSLISAALILWAFPAAARIALGGPCDIANNHLDGTTKEFITDCDSFGFCTLNGTCVPRQCRRDQYVLTSLLRSGNPIPPLCPAGSFCPDDASGCLPLVELGGRCQLNRDDECSPPPNYPDRSSPLDGTDTGAICLLGACTWSNKTQGDNCTIETTTYIGYDLSGTMHQTSVIRDDCIGGEGYCASGTNQCMPLKGLKAACSEDRECHSYNCDGGTCHVEPEAAVQVAKWVYALISLALAFGMIIIIYALVRIHRNTQLANQKMLDEYYSEQTKYRNSILSFHSALSQHERTASSLKVNILRDSPRGAYKSQPMRSKLSSSSAYDYDHEHDHSYRDDRDKPRRSPSFNRVRDDSRHYARDHHDDKGRGYDMDRSDSILSEECHREEAPRRTRLWEREKY